jgi:hypothetical protein
VLAGHFYERRVAEVRRIVEAHGGRVVQDVDEARTLPGLAGAARWVSPPGSPAPSAPRRDAP